MTKKQLNIDKKNGIFYKTMKKTLVQNLELPKEIVLNLPLLTIIGTEELRLENYKNIIEFSEEKIRINTSCGILKIEGKNLLITEITSSNILIEGLITSYSYF